MPRILLSTYHIVPLVLQDLGMVNRVPEFAHDYPPLPQPFHSTRARLERVRKQDLAARWDREVQDGLTSSKKVFSIPDAITDGIAEVTIRQ